MKRILHFILGAALLSCLACHREPSRGEVSHECVRRMAQEYYTCLAEGRYQDYVAAMAQADSMPPQLRSQLQDAVAQLGARIRSQRGGIISATAVSDSLGETCAHVFLQVLFADSTTEQVGLPLVLQDGCWRIH